MKRLTKIGIGIAAVITIAVLAIVADVQSIKSGALLKPEPGMRSEITMVLGASVNEDGTPSDALRDRLQVAVDLYTHGNTQKIFLSGDDGEYHSDEIDAMKKFVLDHGVPAEDTLVDGKGYRTYESCKHFAQVSEQEQASSLIVVTQRFHMARALYLCEHLGAGTFGITSDLESYRSIAYFWARDLLASVKAWWDINVWPPNSPIQ